MTAKATEEVRLEKEALRAENRYQFALGQMLSSAERALTAKAAFVKAEEDLKELDKANKDFERARRRDLKKGKR